MLDRTEDCTIGSSTLSDHSPSFITISPSYRDPLKRHWRLNPSLLSNDNFCTYLNKQFDIYIKANDKDGADPSMVWEAAKAYIRGAIISFVAAKRTRELVTQIKLESE